MYYTFWKIETFEKEFSTRFWFQTETIYSIILSGKGLKLTQKNINPPLFGVNLDKLFWWKWYETPLIPDIDWKLARIGGSDRKLIVW